MREKRLGGGSFPIWGRPTILRVGPGLHVGGVDAGHLRRGATFVRVVGEGQPGHGLPDRTGIGGGWQAEGLVPGERAVREREAEGPGRPLFQEGGEEGSPARHGGATAAPVVDLARGEADEAGEPGLADAGAGKQRGEFRVQERGHRVYHIEFSSISEAPIPSLWPLGRDKGHYRAEANYPTYSRNPRSGSDATSWPTGHSIPLRGFVLGAPPARYGTVALRPPSRPACPGGGAVVYCASALRPVENPCRAVAFAGLTLTRSARRASARRPARSWPRIVTTGSTASRWIPPGSSRALERVYRQGFVDAHGEQSMLAADDVQSGDAIDWALIPPRPRTAFWTICLFILGKGERTDGAGHLVPATTEQGTPGWQLVLPSGNFEKNPLGEKTIVPLVQLALLELAAGAPECLLVSARGRATWWRFLERGGQYPEDLTLV